MPESCQNCGAELYEGQQFCRRCGVSVGTSAAASGEAPTQLLQHETQPAQGAAVATSQVRAETGRVGAGQPTAYHAPTVFNQTSPLVGQPFGSRPLAVEPPARRRRRGLWLCALLAVFVLGVGLASAGAYVWWRTTHRPVIVRKSNTPGVPVMPAIPEPPPIPENLGERIKEALKGAGVPLPVDESGAVVSGETTVVTRTYELGDDAAFAVHAFNGGVNVTGGDGDNVVVKIVKSGGSAAQRGGVRVLESKTDEGLTLLTTPGQAAAVSVSYEISVPRHLRQLAISADKGDVRVSGFTGAVTSDVKVGEVEFRDVSGEVRSKVIKGNTKVFQNGAEREGAQEFSVVKGDIEATFADGAAADLKAETLTGDIEVADDFGLRVVKAPAGRHVAGQLGGGGEALLFKVTNGDIRLKK